MAQQGYYGLPTSSWGRIRRIINQYRATHGTQMPQHLIQSMIEGEMSALASQATQNRQIDIQQKQYDTSMAENQRQFNINKRQREEELDAQKKQGAISTGISTTLLGAYMYGKGNEKGWWGTKTPPPTTSPVQTSVTPPAAQTPVTPPAENYWTGDFGTADTGMGLQNVGVGGGVPGGSSTYGTGAGAGTTYVQPGGATEGGYAFNYGEAGVGAGAGAGAGVGEGAGAAGELSTSSTWGTTSGYVSAAATGYAAGSAVGGRSTPQKLAQLPAGQRLTTAQSGSVSGGGMGAITGTITGGPGWGTVIGALSGSYGGWKAAGGQGGMVGWGRDTIGIPGNVSGIGEINEGLDFLHEAVPGHETEIPLLSKNTWLCTEVRKYIGLDEEEQGLLSKLRRYAVKHHNGWMRAYWNQGGKLVQKINEKVNIVEFYEGLKVFMLDPIFKMLRNGDFEGAYDLYKTDTVYLIKTYAPEIEIKEAV